jgi:hypothetical protein
MQLVTKAKIETYNYTHFIHLHTPEETKKDGRGISLGLWKILKILQTGKESIYREDKTKIKDTRQ